MNKIEAIRETLCYLQPQCNYCGSLFKGPGTPATRECFFPRIDSHFDSRFVCDRHDINSYRLSDLDEIKESLFEKYDLEFPVKEFEFKDLPYANSIRTLMNADIKFWDNRNKQFEDMILKGNLIYKERYSK